MNVFVLPTTIHKTIIEKSMIYAIFYTVMRTVRLNLGLYYFVNVWMFYAEEVGLSEHLTMFITVSS